MHECCSQIDINVLCFPQANQKFNTRWTTEEQLLAVQGNFGHISQVVVG